MYDEAALLSSPEGSPEEHHRRRARSPAAAADRSSFDDPTWVATHCGGCFEEGNSFPHACYRANVDEKHVVPLHSAMMCEHVVMPTEGYYFCNMTCLHAYNSEKELNDIVQVMPDGGLPGNASEYDFQLRTMERRMEQQRRRQRRQRRRRARGGGECHTWWADQSAPSAPTVTFRDISESMACSRRVSDC